MDRGVGRAEALQRHLIVGREDVRRHHIFVAERRDAVGVRHREIPRRQHGVGIVGSAARMTPLPFGPQAVDVAVMAPENRVERGAAGVDHVAGRKVVVRADRVGALAAGEIVDEVVDVLERTEKLIVHRTAAEGEEVVDAENALDILGRRIGLEDQVAVAARPAPPVKQRIDLTEHRDDRGVAVGRDAERDVGGLEEARARAEGRLADEAAQAAQHVGRDLAAVGEFAQAVVVDPALIGGRDIAVVVRGRSHVVERGLDVVEVTRPVPVGQASRLGRCPAAASRSRTDRRGAR